MRLTFKGFLLDYCQELAGARTSSIKKLCAAAGHDAPRVAEPLFFYALETGRIELLLRSSEGTWMHDDYRSLARSAEGYEADALRFSESCTLPDRYARVAAAFHAQRNSVDADRRVIALMRDRTVEALDASGVTKYRLCKDLGLNMGNVYAYLNRGDVTKVSRDTARRILEYASG